MDIIKVLATVLLIGALVFAIVKKYHIVTSLFIISLVTLVIVTIVSGESLLGEDSLGNKYLDVFEYIGNNLVSRTASSGILLMSVMGFAAYMNHTKASVMLATLAAKPLIKLNKPYLVVSLAFLLGILLHLFIPSHAAFTTLLMAVFYPIFMSVGVSKKTAVASIIISGSIDMGPADPVTNFIISSKIVDMDVTEFFLTKQLPIVAIVVSVMSILIYISNKRADIKDGFSASQQTEIASEDLSGVPKWYAVLPTIPLVLVFVFSKLIMGSVTISVIAANIIGFFLAFAAELIVKRNVKKCMEETQQFYLGMGNSFGSVVVMVTAAGIFASCIDKSGGLGVVTKLLSSSNAGGFLISFISGLITFISALVTGSGLASGMSFIPLLPDITSATGSSLLAALIPMEIGASLGRALSPVTAAVIVACKMTDLDIIEIGKRNIFPIISGYILLVVLSVIML